MKKIGKGAFTDAYLMDNGKVLLKSSCPIKECMSMGWFPTCYLFPSIERINYDERSEYVMEYYPKVKSLKDNLSPRQWRLYNALRKLSVYGDPRMLFDRWHSELDSLPSEFAKEKEWLKEALDACGNYGTDIEFEISPRNVAVKGNKLVLLDCFFCVSELNMVRSNKNR